MNTFIVVSIAFVLIYLVVGVYAGRRVHGLNDFYVMGRNAPVILIVGTIIATNISSVTIIGYVGQMYEVGPIPYVGFYMLTTVSSIFIGMYLGRYLWRMGMWTLPDFFARRYPSNGVRIVATALVALSMILYLVSVLQTTGIAINQLFGWSPTISILLILLLITAFTFIGGMLGVVITDTIMLGVFFIGCLAMVPFVYAAAGGWPEALQTASAELPGFTKWKGSQSTFDGFWFLVEANIVGFVVNVASPQLLSRVYIARSEKTLARAQLWVALLTPIFVFGFLYSFGLAPLVAENIDPANTFPYIASNLVPVLIGALALAGVVAAAISTASSLFQQGAAALSRDIYQRFIRPDASEPRLMLVSRLCVIIMALIVTVILLTRAIGEASVLYGFLFASAAWAAWLPVLIAGVVWRRATTAAAFWSMTVALVLTLIVGFGREFGYSPAWLPPNLVALVSSTILVIVVSLCTRPSEEETRVFEEMRQPAASRRSEPADDQVSSIEERG